MKKILVVLAMITTLGTFSIQKADAHGGYCGHPYGGYYGGHHSHYYGCGHWGWDRPWYHHNHDYGCGHWGWGYPGWAC